MIPKILHYCWFGGKEKPQEVNEYMETWKRMLPDYQLMEWNESNFDYKARTYTREAYTLKKYAFVSDVCRLEALYQYGGLYLDTDIEVVGSFKPFEDLKSFIGYEVNDLVGTGVIGAEKKAEWIKIFLDTYKEKDFYMKDGSLNITPNTITLTKLLPSIPVDIRPTIFPLETFCAKHWKTHEIIRNETTVSIHHYRDSWHDNEKTSFIDLANRAEGKICRVLHLPCYRIVAHCYKIILKFRSL